MEKIFHILFYILIFYGNFLEIVWQEAKTKVLI